MEHWWNDMDKETEFKHEDPSALYFLVPRCKHAPSRYNNFM
jgi:hypothetical protein